MARDAGRLPELLAPVGGWDALVAAVQSGADAVYLGGKEYSARQFAENFGPEELNRAVSYAHVRGVRVYVTVNTLIKDAELRPALTYLAELYEAGVDALILQDIGLMRLARRVLPSLPIHASTQATVHHPDGVRWVRDLGADRVVLARELSLAEIEACSSTGTETEVFVHGALCVCYSGQCLMSSMIGGRSGNRGRCAQPCRLEYGLVDRDGRLLSSEEETGPYLLSTRELAALDLLPDLAQAGVSALKIEGRMKRPEYVATVVRVYREALDRLAEGQAAAAGADSWQDLAQAFNRGFTPGYLLGNPGRELMSYQRPSNRGVFLGRVSHYDRRRGLAVLRLENEVAVGDGLEVWVSKGGRVGVTLSRFWRADRRDAAAQPLEKASPGERIVIPVNGAISTGDRVFKTSDAALQARASAAFHSPREILQIPLRAVLTVRRGEPAKLAFTDPEGVTGEACGTVAATEAERHALAAEAVRTQLDRLGNTPFRLGEVELNLDAGTMLPWSELNALRRAALQRLEEARAARHRPADREVGETRRRLAEVLREWAGGGGKTPDARARASRPVLAVALSEPDGLPEVIKAGPDRVILGGERFRPARYPLFAPAEVAQSARLCRKAGVELVLGFPRIIRHHELETAVSLALATAARPEEERPAAFLIGNLGLLYRLRAARREGLLSPAVDLHADWPLNICNGSALALLASQEVTQATLSPELTLEEVRRVAAGSPVSLEILVHGPLELMVTEYCAPGALVGRRGPDRPCSQPCLEHGGFGLRDRLGMVFPLRLDASCRMHVGNAKELCLIEHLEALAAAGPQVFRLDCRLRDTAYAVAVTRLYREGLSALGRQDAAERLACGRKELELLSPSGVTKGHYFRGVE